MPHDPAHAALDSMTARFIGARLLPFAAAFLALIAAAVVADVILHRAHLPEIGRWFGPIGSALLLTSFLYSLRKRKWIKAGSPKRLLALHEVLGWIGALVLLVHGGVHLNAWIPWLALVALIVVVVSGLSGKYLLARAKESLAERRKALTASGMAGETLERELLGMALLVDTMQQWRRVHMPLTMVFLGLSLVHVVVTVVLW